jgi:ribosomal protein L40E
MTWICAKCGARYSSETWVCLKCGSTEVSPVGK